MKASSESQKPLVSVFIPYYNDEKFLYSAIDSVLKQTFEDFELILLNHASTDSSRDIAHSFNDPRVKHVDLDYNYGAGGGLLFRIFVKFAKGTYLKPFCADDLMKTDCLEHLVSFMDEHTEIDFCFGNVEYMDSDGNSLHDDWYNARPGFDYYSDFDLLRKYYNCTSVLPYIGSMIKACCLYDIELDNSIIMMFDMSLWFSLLLHGRHVGYYDGLVANYRIHDGQISGIKQKEIVVRRSLFEPFAYRCILNSNIDIDLARELLIAEGSIYASKLREKSDIPFVANELSFRKYEDYVSYNNIHNMLQDEGYRVYLEKEFSFTVKTFRDLYSGKIASKEENSRMKRFKDGLYSTSSGELSSVQLLYLLIRRIKVSLFDRHASKRYSM